ncbi:MAG: DUF533 domain-containing protein [Candidatus Eisenbacteria bacterium]
MFSTGRLLDALIQSQMGGGSGRRGRRRRRSRGLGGAVRGAALSPQGLTLLGGLAIAAIEHLRGKGEPTFSGGTPGGTGNTGSAPAGGARSDLPPLPSDPDGARAGLPPLPDQVGAASASPDSTPATPTTPEQDALARVLVLAMIEAAKADGVVDEQEKARIEAQLQEAGASDEEREWARGQLAAAPDLPGLLAAVPAARGGPGLRGGARGRGRAERR